MSAANAIKAPATLADRNDRRAVCQELVELEAAIAAEVAKIEAYKSALRAMCDKAGEGFKEEFADLGTVKVSKGSEPKFRGIVPELKPEAFLALNERRRGELVKQGLVEMVSQYSRKSSSSVTVTLA